MMSKGRNTIRQQGFTLVELMITLAIAAIILTFAIPGFVNLIKDNRQSTQINGLLNALSIARSESIKLNRPVTVCQSSDGAGCTNAGWDSGWIVFSDLNTRGSVDGNDQVLQVFGSLSGQTTVVSANFANFITYDSDGTSNNNGEFIMCDDRGAASAKALCVTATGRAYVSKTGCNGGGIACP